uniref:N-acetylmuramoyl-L-alanine amidase n=1 Tax=Agathobacter sp. TaxID=2021311 RepID=UPI004057BB57
MKRSKHFRKDVVIARVIFTAICAMILALVISGITALLKNREDKDTDDSEKGSFISESILPGTQQESEANAETERYVVTAVRVKLRTEPNTDCEVIATLEAGERMVLAEELSGWYKVHYQDTEGFVSADYAKKELSEETTESTQDNFERSDYMVMIDPAGEALHFTIAGLLKQELESRGYAVGITRNADEGEMTAEQRAEAAAGANADITISIHTNNSEDASLSGATAVAPSSANANVGTLAENSQKLSQEIINAYCGQTGMANAGVTIDDAVDEINYASMPVSVLFMGYQSNPSDSSNMQDSEYQEKMVQAIADGVDAYFAQQ